MLSQILCAHRAIAIVLTLFVALGILYSVTTPLFEAPDEQWHFAFVQHVATGHGLPVQVEPLPHLARQEGSQPPLYYVLAAGATFWIDTTDFPNIVWENPHYGYNVPGIVNDNKNLFIHTALESFPYRGAVLAIHLARLVSVLMGALAVLFTYLLAREIFPTRKILAAGAAAIVAFNPQFLFISGAVSNDSTIVAMSALTLWLMAASGQRSEVREQRSESRGQRSEVREQRSEVGRRMAFGLGMACGLAALAKVSGLGLAVLAVLVLVGSSWRDSKIRAQRSGILSHWVLFTVAFVLVSGWWYARNLILYGEVTGTARMIEIFYVRAAPLPFDQLLVQLREVWETFWVGFGWGNVRAYPVVYSVIEIFVALSLVGWIVARAKSRFAVRLSSLGILLAWVVLMFAALIYWMQSTQAPHGRLFFPALPAVAVLLAVGLDQFQRSEVKGQRSAISNHVSRFMHHGLLLPFCCSLLLRSRRL